MMVHFFLNIKINLIKPAVTKEDQVENGQQSPAIDKLNVPSSAITKGALIGKGRFGDILEGSVTGRLLNQ